MPNHVHLILVPSDPEGLRRALAHVHSTPIHQSVDSAARGVPCPTRTPTLSPKSVFRRDVAALKPVGPAARHLSDILCCRKSSVAWGRACDWLNSFDCSACHTVSSLQSVEDRYDDRDNNSILCHGQRQHIRGPRLRGVSLAALTHGCRLLRARRAARRSRTRFLHVRASKCFSSRASQPRKLVFNPGGSGSDLKLVLLNGSGFSAFMNTASSQGCTGFHPIAARAGGRPPF